MGHGSTGSNAVKLVGNGTGGAVAAADIRGSGTQNCCIHALCPARTKFHHRTSLSRSYHPIGLGSDQALMIDTQQQEGFDQLGLDSRGTDSNDGFFGKYRRSFGNRPDIAGKVEICQIFQELLAEQTTAAQIRNILSAKV